MNEITPALQILSYVAQLSPTGEKLTRKRIQHDLGIEKSVFDGTLSELEKVKWIKYKWISEEGALSKSYSPSHKGEEVLRLCDLPPYG